MKIVEFFRSGFTDPENVKRGQSLGLGLGLALAVTAAIAASQGRMERMHSAGIASAILLSLGLILPGLLYAPARAMEEAFKLVSRATMYALLVLVFYLVSAPAGIALRILGRDPLQRRLDPSAKSYWQDRPPNPPERAEKQF